MQHYALHDGLLVLTPWYQNFHDTRPPWIAPPRLRLEAAFRILRALLRAGTCTFS